MSATVSGFFCLLLLTTLPQAVYADSPDVTSNEIARRILIEHAIVNNLDLTDSVSEFLTGDEASEMLMETNPQGVWQDGSDAILHHHLMHEGTGGEVKAVQIQLAETAGGGCCFGYPFQKIVQVPNA